MPDTPPYLQQTLPVSGNGQFTHEESEISLKDIYYILRRNFKLVFWAGFGVFFGTGIFTALQPPMYESTSMIIVEEPNQSMTVFDLGFGEEMNLLNNEMEILKSRSLAEAVVRHMWDSPRRNSLFLFGTRMYIPEGPRRLVRQVLTLGLWNPDTTQLPDYAGTLPDSILSAAAGNLRESLEITNQRQTNVLNLTVKSTAPDEAALLANTIIELYQQRDLAVNAGEIINLKQFLEEQSAKVEADLHQAEENLRDFQEREQIYGLEGNAGLLLQQLTNIEARYYTTVAEINIARERKRFISEQLSEEERTLAEKLVSSINSRVFALRTEIASTEADVVRNASLYSESHDLVRTGREKIEKLKRELESQTRDLVAQGLRVADPIKYRQALIDSLINFEGVKSGLESRAGEYRKLVEQYNRQLGVLPAKSLQYARLERDRKVLSETYLLMRQKLEEARIAQASQLSKVRIIDPAIPPRQRSKPNTKMNLLLGLFLGGGLGVGLAFVREYLDNTVKTVDDIERRGLTVLGIIPAIGDVRYQRRGKHKRRSRERAEVEPGSGTPAAAPNAGEDDNGDPVSLKAASIRRMQRRLITHEDPKSPISEAYRSLRTSLMYSSVDREVKSIIVSSPGPGEGKTTTVANLAITYANLGKRTLLLDTDLRRPVLHRVFGLPRDPGITQYLAGVIKDFDAIVNGTEVQNLFIVPSGVVPPNPSELLGSKRMVELISRLEEEWDIILLDSPPLVAVTDATLVSREIDQLVLVVKSGQTDKGAFNRTLLAMKNVAVPLAGVVMNAVTSKNSYGSYYYYYQYYHYYGDSGK